jgi:hypothetical protein
MVQPLPTPLEEELNQLEVLIRQLKQQYDIFFAGAAKRPPLETRKTVESRVEILGRTPMQRFSDRYRFNTLAGKYQTYRELWQKLMRMREEGYLASSARNSGVTDAMRAVADESKPGDGSKPGDASKSGARSRDGGGTTVFRSRFTDPTSEDDTFKGFYDKYVEARKSQGADSGVSYSTFLKLIAQKTASIKEKVGCESVTYSIVLKEGAVSLKAAPVREKKEKKS